MLHPCLRHVLPLRSSEVSNAVPRQERVRPLVIRAATSLAPPAGPGQTPGTGRQGHTLRSMTGSLLGNAVRRIEDPDLVRGRGTFVDNMRPQGVLFAAFVRTPLASATITGIDTSEAAAAPGVVAVFTASDLELERGFPFFPTNPRCARPPLADGKVRFVGEAVAVVIAETKAQAVDATELVDVDYEPLDVVVDMEAAISPGAALQFDDVAGNVAASARTGEPDALAGATHVVRARIENQRLAVAPMEGNALLVTPGGPDEPHDVTLHMATQMPHLARASVARTFGLDQDRVRVVAPHVGGAFGGKAGVPAEHVVLVAAARRLGRPVSWAETRSEAMLSMHGRGQVQFVELGLDERRTHHRPALPGDRRLRRLRRLRRDARRGSDPDDGHRRVRRPAAGLLGDRRPDEHHAGRRLPRCGTSRGRGHAGADHGPRGRRAGPGPGRDPPAQPARQGRVPLHDADGDDVRHRGLRPGPRRGAADRGLRRAPHGAGRAPRARRRHAARHRARLLRRGDRRRQR